MEGETPLHCAAFAGTLPCAKLLVLSGADVNVRNLQGNTPLMWAVLASNVAMVRLLLNSGANPLICDLSAMTAVHMAVRAGMRDCVELALEGLRRTLFSSLLSRLAPLLFSSVLVASRLLAVLFVASCSCPCCFSCSISSSGMCSRDLWCSAAVCSLPPFPVQMCVDEEGEEVEPGSEGAAETKGMEVDGQAQVVSWDEWYPSSDSLGVGMCSSHSDLEEDVRELEQEQEQKQEQEKEQEEPRPPLPQSQGEEEDQEEEEDKEADAGSDPAASPRSPSQRDIDAVVVLPLDTCSPHFSHFSLFSLLLSLSHAHKHNHSHTIRHPSFLPS